MPQSYEPDDKTERLIFLLDPQPTPASDYQLKLARALLDPRPYASIGERDPFGLPIGSFGPPPPASSLYAAGAPREAPSAIDQPPEDNSNAVPGPGGLWGPSQRWVRDGDKLHAQGSQHLIDNPILKKLWESTRSGWHKKGGFTPGFQEDWRRADAWIAATSSWIASSRRGPDIVFSMLMDLAILLGELVVTRRPEYRWSLDLDPDNDRDGMVSFLRPVVQIPAGGPFPAPIIFDFEEHVVCAYLKWRNPELQSRKSSRFLHDHVGWPVTAAISGEYEAFDLEKAAKAERRHLDSPSEATRTGAAATVQHARVRAKEARQPEPRAMPLEQEPVLVRSKQGGIARLIHKPFAPNYPTDGPLWAEGYGQPALERLLESRARRLARLKHCLASDGIDLDAGLAADRPEPLALMLDDWTYTRWQDVTDEALAEPERWEARVWDDAAAPLYTLILDIGVALGELAIRHRPTLAWGIYDGPGPEPDDNSYICVMLLGPYRPDGSGPTITYNALAQARMAYRVACYRLARRSFMDELTLALDAGKPR
jgi:hypothetical protein